MANDIAKLRRKTAKGVDFEEVLEEGFCNGLGYNHSPYAWLENVCDEMIDDKLGEWCLLVVIMLFVALNTARRVKC